MHLHWQLTDRYSWFWWCIYRKMIRCSMRSEVNETYPETSIKPEKDGWRLAKALYPGIHCCMVDAPAQAMPGHQVLCVGQAHTRLARVKWKIRVGLFRYQKAVEQMDGSMGACCPQKNFMVMLTTHWQQLSDEWVAGMPNELVFCPFTEDVPAMWTLRQILTFMPWHFLTSSRTSIPHLWSWRHWGSSQIWPWMVLICCGPTH